ncbi:MAG: KpsF/GutQ family sugar-phosphate isomerase [Verrucomicrobiae bacterium]|nr:KpsF/GutQ family sugar-phosphate isomerase [Verrucomicrobiae bacterium]
MDHITRARRVIELEIAELQRLRDRIGDSFTSAVQALQVAIENRGKIIVAGVGKSGNIGAKIAATFNSTGATAVVLNSQDALHGDLGVVNDGDVAIVLSHSGETDEITSILPHLRSLQLTLIAVTGRPESMLARHSDIVLDVNVEREACPLNLAPTSSSTVMLVLGDALAMVLLEARGFKASDFARLHPGGSLGRSLLLKVAEIMRGGNAMAKVGLQTSVADALSAMIRVRGGAAVVVNDATEKVSGIFTQGDFVRAFEKNPGIGEDPVCDHMTPGPITISSDCLAVEVINLFNEHRIDDLIVIDSDGKPVGMVDTQDLSRVRLI